MSTATAEHVAHDEHDEHHPKDLTYWKVGLALGLITAAEVSTYFVTSDPYSHDLAPLLIGGLLIMMTLKFVTIGAFFMHLKFDSKLFRTVFIAGIILALAVYGVVMTAFEFWDNGYEAGMALLR